MLVLTRKSMQKIQVGENITITVLRVKGGAVKLGIDAPRDVRVLRSELPVMDLEASEAVASSLPTAGSASQPAANEMDTDDEGDTAGLMIHRLVAPERRRNVPASIGCPAVKTSLRAIVAATRKKPCGTI